MFGLRRALDMLFEEGLDNVFQRHALLAAATRAAVVGWAQGGAMELNILEPDARANSVTTVLMEQRYLHGLIDYARDKCNVVLGIGIGAQSGKAFRIAHMGYVNAPMLLGTLGVIEMGLKALAIPHGNGLQSAIEVLAHGVPAQRRETVKARSESCCC